MSYVRIPSTVSKIQAENRLQREFLQKCEQQFLKYQQWCPQLIGPLDELRRVMYALTRNIDIQDALIQQRIRIQASLIHPELGNATAYYPSNAETFTRIPDNIWLPSLNENKTPMRLKYAQAQRQTTVYTTTDARLPHQSPSTGSKFLCHKTSLVASTRGDRRNTTSNLCSTRPQKAERFSQSLKAGTCLSTPWRLIPSHLRAYPSLFEQLINQRKPVPTPIEWQNRFAPLFTEYHDNEFDTDSTIELPTMMYSQVVQGGTDHNPMTDAENMAGPNFPPSQPVEHDEPTVPMDMLRHMLDVPALDTTSLQDTSSQYAEVVQVVPQCIHKVPFEVNIKFPKNTQKVDRILSVFEVARRFDKSVCLCPSGKEPNSFLYGPKDIKYSRLHRYFQDKPGAQNGKNANNLYGFIVFGIT